ncbi:MAG TPA: hypothetical protein VFE88_03200 [Candidatus Nanoarchaeia archaeon]|nr:hypothetical protein [Candidatus Nanoarchaeia archaeon]
MNHKAFNIYALSVLLTLIITRIFLSISPETNFYLLGYNIHHLYTGLFLLILLLPFLLFHKSNIIFFLLAGVATALILDEFVYLLFTNGTDAAYLGTVSLWGMILFSIFYLLYTYLIVKSFK